MVKILCIVQARLTSSRLPNKVLMELGNSGLSILEHVYQRLNMSKHIDKVVFAIPDTHMNDKLADFLDQKKFAYFRGSEDNVLERFVKCAKLYKPEIIVRATCDNPFVDWVQVDRMIESLGNNDYVSSIGAPLGTAPEVFYSEALYRSFDCATLDVEKEHVTPYIYTHPHEFAISKINYYIPNVTNYRLTVDTDLDFEVADKVYRALYKNEPITNCKVYTYLHEHQEIKDINNSVEQKRI